MIERLEATLTKYESIEKELTNPEVLSDIKKTRELSKEMSSIEELVTCYKKYKKVLNAMESVRHTGYGVVTPDRNEIELDTPEIIKHGSKYGVKIKAVSPSVHFIKANVITEIAPIVGTEQQAKDLISYIGQSRDDNNSIWDTNIFG